MYPLKCEIVIRMWYNVNTDGRAQSHVTSSRSRFVGTTEKPVEGEEKRRGVKAISDCLEGGRGVLTFLYRSLVGSAVWLRGIFQEISISQDG